MTNTRYYLTSAAALILWTALYMLIEPAARWITYGLLPIAPHSAVGAALEFFLYDTAKILLLLVIMVYLVAWLRAALNVDRVRTYLQGKGRAVGYLFGAGFGAITPFCSCSSIPLFVGFSTARIPIGITMAFLITSPLINEVAVVLLWGLLGWKFTTIYVTVGLLVGIVGGIIMDALKAERWLQPFLFKSMTLKPLTPLGGRAGESCCGGSAAGLPNADVSTSPQLRVIDRHAFAKQETISIFHKVWRWVIIGVALGALLHGYVPQEWFAEHLGAGQWWSVPVAVLIGIPLYTNVTGIIPIMESLLLKGLPIGTTLAFCMSAVAASLPEVMMLKQVMRWQLLAIFLGMLLVIFTVMGWFFNLLAPYIF